MLKQQVRQAVPKPQERTHRTTGINLPTETWELLRRVAFERSRRSGGRGFRAELRTHRRRYHGAGAVQQRVSPSESGIFE